MNHVLDYGADLGESADRAGARGRALSQMAALGMPVPPGFVVTDIACRRFLETGDIPSAAWAEVIDGLARTAESIRERGNERSDTSRPVLYSVRSSPPVAMPGLFDSALYLGCTPQAMEQLARWGGRRLALTARLGFLKAIGRLRSLPGAHYSLIVADIAGPAARSDWSDDQIEEVCSAYEAVVADVSQRPIPDDVPGQVREGIEGVFASWDGLGAHRFRRVHGLSDDDGMGVVIHPMIFGELDDDSGAGYVVSRDPLDGSPEIVGRYEPGSNRPAPGVSPAGLEGFRGVAPADYDLVIAAVGDLERSNGDIMRIDFVRERGRIWMIEGRPAERSPESAVRVAVDMVEEGLMSTERAILSVDPESLAGMLHPRLASPPADEPLAVGTATSPGAASGRLVFSVPAAVAAAEGGEPAILVLREVLPRDLDGVVSAAGLITSHGGGTSHAAVAARAAGSPAVTGIADVVLSADSVRIGGRTLTSTDVVTIDGSTGLVYAGELGIVQPPAASYLDRLLEWADAVRRLGVWANADTARAAVLARAAGAEGIGLARSEYMFHGERLAVVRRILLSADVRERAYALEELETLQIADF